MKITGHDNLTTKAYDLIKELILKGEVRQGELISISHMAEQLNISRTPISAACQRLEYEKFLTIVPKQGVIINTISLETAKEIYELRAAIESYNAKRAFQLMTETDIKVLEESLDKQRQHVKNNDNLAFMKEDTFFHRYILAKISNYEFLSVIDTLYDRAFLLGMKNSNPVRLKQNIEEHEQIIEMLKHGDRQSFADAIEHNILNGYRCLTNNLLL